MPELDGGAIAVNMNYCIGKVILMKSHAFPIAILCAILFLMMPVSAFAMQTNSTSLKSGTPSVQAEKIDISNADVTIWFLIGSDGRELLRVQYISLYGKLLSDFGYYAAFSAPLDWSDSSEGIQMVKITPPDTSGYTGTAIGTYAIKEGYYDNRDFSKRPYRGIHLSKSKYYYAGKACMPGVLFFNDVYTDNDSWFYPKPKSSEYRVTYKGSSSVGVATATISGTGENYFTGSFDMHYTILPPNTKISKVTSKKTKSKIAWRLPSKACRKQIDGYQVMYGKRIATVKGKNKASVTIKNPKRKKFKVCVRTYKRACGKTYYSKWSKKKTVKPRRRNYR